MPKITFIDTEGNKRDVDAPLGLSVLEIAHKNDIDLEGACEGSLACSTCHEGVYKPLYGVSMLKDYPELAKAGGVTGVPVQPASPVAPEPGPAQTPGSGQPPASGQPAQ